MRTRILVLAALLATTGATHLAGSAAADACLAGTGSIGGVAVDDTVIILPGVPSVHVEAPGPSVSVNC